MDELRDMYDELENIVDTLESLSNSIRYNKDIEEQLDEIRFDAEKEMEELGHRLEKLEDAENRELEFEYIRSRI